MFISDNCSFIKKSSDCGEKIGKTIGNVVGKTVCVIDTAAFGVKWSRINLQE